MMRFWFDGECSADFGMIISGSGTFNAPQRDVDIVSILGRNGDLIIDNGRYLNTTVTYPVSILRDFSRRALSARSWLLSKSGYKRLEDDYHPDHFRLATFLGPLDFDAKLLNRVGETTLKFNCKPQRFLKQGEYSVNVVSGQSIHNPTAFVALPSITVYGSGAGDLIIGGLTVQIKELKDQITLDCELQDAYRHVGDGAPENKNRCIYAPKFPVLQPGNNKIVYSGGITGVKIIPRWWEL